MLISASLPCRPSANGRSWRVAEFGLRCLWRARLVEREVVEVQRCTSTHE